MSDQTAMRAHAWDFVKATPVATFLGWLLSGHTLSYLATATGLLYTCLITFQKLRELGVFRWIARRFAPKVPAPPPPGVRQTQDE